MKTASTSITITAVVGFGKTVVMSMIMSIIMITIITNLNDKDIMIMSMIMITIITNLNDKDIRGRVWKDRGAQTSFTNLPLDN